MEEIIGYKTLTMFRFNCYSETADEERICEFQISGEGNRNEMIRLHNTLLDNGFHISSVESVERSIPIIDRFWKKEEPIRTRTRTEPVEIELIDQVPGMIVEPVEVPAPVIPEDFDI